VPRADHTRRSWLLLRYPLPKPTRARLVALYYALVLLPGLEARVTRGWADMLTRLLDLRPGAGAGGGAPRLLEPADLALAWRPLWRALRRELWPKRRAQDGARNVVNILLYVAEHCRRYYPREEIPAMLDEFLPLITQEVGGQCTARWAMHSWANPSPSSR
jgi:proteasome activator subunit 4